MELLEPRLPNSAIARSTISATSPPPKAHCPAKHSQEPSIISQDDDNIPKNAAHNPNVAPQYSPATNLPLMPVGNASPARDTHPPTQAALHFHAIDHSLRRLDLLAPHNLTRTDLPLK